MTYNVQHMSGRIDTAGRIRAARKARRWTQEQAAEALGVSLPMVRAMERGSRQPGPRTQQALRSVLGIGSGGGDGDGDGPPAGMLTLDDLEHLLGAGWALFYAGKGGAALTSVESCLRALSDHADPGALALRGRFHQLAGVILRDHTGAKGDSLTHGAAAVQLARQVDAVDDLASALFRLARSAQHLHLDDQAVRLIAEAHSLAPRCRQPLAGWLHLAMIETQARVSAPTLALREARQLIDRAHSDLANRAGQDRSFTALNTPGIWHVDVLATLFLGGNPHEALSRIGGAITELHRIDPGAHRWRAGMQATEALAYAAIGDAQACADLAGDVLHVSRATSHIRYLRQGLALLTRQDARAMNPHVARLRRLLAF